MKTQVENGLIDLFDIRGHTIDMSDQDVFTLKYLVINDKEGNKINISDPLTATHKLLGRFWSFMMKVHPE